jgi:hypothetical protein
VALRPRFSTSLPFRSPALSNNKVNQRLKQFGRIPAKNMPSDWKKEGGMSDCLGSNRSVKLRENIAWKNRRLFENG